MTTELFTQGDPVMFADHVVQRLGHDKQAADARGVVLDVAEHIAKVDFKGTWIPHSNGGTVRYVPVINLSKCINI